MCWGGREGGQKKIVAGEKGDGLRWLSNLPRSLLLRDADYFPVFRTCVECTDQRSPVLDLGLGVGCGRYGNI